MSRLRVTVATGDYDITRPLLDGALAPAGLDLVGVTMPSPQRHWRMLTHREFDVAELSLGSFCARLSRGEDDLVGLPVFPHRRFRHGYAFVSAASGIRAAADLAGRTVGVRSWQTTAGVWLRGILEEYHGLPLDSVHWLAQDGEDVPLDLPDGLELTRVAAGEKVTDLCAAGRIEGLIYPELPRQVLAGDGTIERVFDDPKAAEQDYFRRTGIFPVMHVVAVRAELVESYPWLPRTLCEVFEESKRLALRRLDNPRTVSLAWLRALQEEERELLGPDPWHYGADALNYRTLDTFLGYARRQGVTARPLSAAQLFHPSVREQIPAYV
ncbi:ABC transporter substrate-binding protein [Streptomyces sp. NPDC050560]|uniref:ABC transporter substrate-binding protein n=1 Tax=Streptomyces sp. NPDC050560 TaxID=3365630 RepID=UPI0037988CE6